MGIEEKIKERVNQLKDQPGYGTWIIEIDDKKNELVDIKSLKFNDENLKLLKYNNRGLYHLIYTKTECAK